MAQLKVLWSRSSIFVCALRQKSRLSRLGSCLTHTHADGSHEEPGRPVQYSKSKAATWRAEDTRSGGHNEDSPWFQPYVVSGSLTVFLIYFCILREENDIDEELGRSLYERIPGLEKCHLQEALTHNTAHGLDTSAITARLQELQEK